MTTNAYRGRGCTLGVSSTSSGFTTIAQLRTFKFAGLKSTLEDVTNLSSPTAFKEWLPTIVDPSDLSFDGVLDPQNATIHSLPGLLQNQTEQYFQITLTDPASTALTFQGYVTEYNPVSVDYSKALMFSGKIQITGPITIAP
jgi:hypothetical protein